MTRSHESRLSGSPDLVRPSRTVARMRWVVRAATWVLIGCCLPAGCTKDDTDSERDAASPAPSVPATSAPVPSRAPRPTPAATDPAPNAAATPMPTTTARPTPAAAPAQRRSLTAKIDAATAARICAEAGLPAPPAADRYHPDLVAVMYNLIERIGTTRSADAIGELGAFYYAVMQNREDSDQVRLCWEKAKELAPEAYQWPHLLGRLFLLRSSGERARLEFERSVELNPEYIGNYSSLGELELSREDGEHAEQYFRRFVELAPDLSHGYVGLADAARLRGDDETALAMLNTAQAKNPNDARTHLAFARYYHAKGDERRAAVHQSVGQRLAPAASPLTSDPLELFLAKAAGPSPRSLQFIAAYYNAGDPVSGDLLANTLLTEYPESGLLLSGIAEVNLRRGRLAKAEELASRALQADPQQAVAAVVLSDARATAGDLAESLRFAERAVEIDPQYAAAHVARSRRLLAMDRPADALAAMKRALELEPNNFTLRNFVGEILLTQNELEEAKSWSEDTIRRGEAEPTISPLIASAYAAKAVVAMRQNDPKVAAQQLLRALRIDPTREAIFRQMISILRDTDNMADALAVCRRLMDENPSVITYALAYGELLAEMGRPDDAITHLQWLSKDLAVHPMPHYTLARILQNQQRYAEARQAIDAALALQPGSEKFQLLRLEIAMGEKNPAAAIEAASTGLAAVPDSLQLKNALAWLLATTADPAARDPRQAVVLAEDVVGRTERKIANFLDTLACAHAAAGDFTRAAATAQEAIDRATEQGQTQLIDQFTERRDMFMRQEAYVEKP